MDPRIRIHPNMSWIPNTGLKGCVGQASVEAMLKSAMQSQLEGVRTGLNQLERALVDVAEIKQCMSDIEKSLGKLWTLS